MVGRAHEVWRRSTGRGLLAAITALTVLLMHAATASATTSATESHTTSARTNHMMAVGAMPMASHQAQLARGVAKLVAPAPSAPSHPMFMHMASPCLSDAAGAVAAASAADAVHSDRLTIALLTVKTASTRALRFERAPPDLKALCIART